MRDSMYQLVVRQVRWRLFLKSCLSPERVLCLTLAKAATQQAARSAKGPPCFRQVCSL